MQISSSYATHAIFQINSSHISSRNSVKTHRESFDTVSISEEAREAYRNFKLEENKPSTSENNQLEAKLTMWFNTWHDGPDFQVKGNIEMEKGSGTILPENKILKSKFEKEIERIIEEENYNSTAVASPELLQKLIPLQQKLNVISALGDSMVLTDQMLEKAGNFLQNMEDAWNELKNGDTSLMGQFHSAVKSWKNGSQDEESIKKEIDEIQDKVLNTLNTEEAVAKAKELAAKDTRDEHDTLDFYQVPSEIAQYVPSELWMGANSIGMRASDMPTEEERKLAMEKHDKIYNAFGQAYSAIGIDYNNLSVKERYYLMKDEQISAALNQSFLNIWKDTQGSSFI